ncbi:MAG: hypothetical protein WAX69_14005, partial [Victivallales bacterium]
DLEKCAEQIGKDYVISWRPSPVVVAGTIDEAKLRKQIKEAMQICEGLHVDITLKDISTVGWEPDRLKQWVGIVQNAIDDCL